MISTLDSDRKLLSSAYRIEEERVGHVQCFCRDLKSSVRAVCVKILILHFSVLSHPSVLSWSSDPTCKTKYDMNPRF
jgi:hypothetical protein